MHITRYTTDIVKTPKGNSVLAIGSIFTDVDFIVYKDIVDNQVNLAIKVGSEDDEFIEGQLPEKFAFSNGYKTPTMVWNAPNDCPEECLKNTGLLYLTCFLGWKKLSTRLFWLAVTGVVIRRVRIHESSNRLLTRVLSGCAHDYSMATL